MASTAGGPLQRTPAAALPQGRRTTFKLQPQAPSVVEQPTAAPQEPPRDQKRENQTTGPLPIVTGCGGSLLDGPRIGDKRSRETMEAANGNPATFVSSTVAVTESDPLPPHHPRTSTIAPPSSTVMTSSCLPMTYQQSVPLFMQMESVPATTVGPGTLSGDHDHHHPQQQQQHPQQQQQEEEAVMSAVLGQNISPVTRHHPSGFPSPHPHPHHQERPADTAGLPSSESANTDQFIAIRGEGMGICTTTTTTTRTTNTGSTNEESNSVTWCTTHPPPTPVTTTSSGWSTRRDEGGRDHAEMRALYGGVDPATMQTTGPSALFPVAPSTASAAAAAAVVSHRPFLATSVMGFPSPRHEEEGDGKEMNGIPLLGSDSYYYEGDNRLAPSSSASPCNPPVPSSMPLQNRRMAEEEEDEDDFLSRMCEEAIHDTSLAFMSSGSRGGRDPNADARALRDGRKGDYEEIVSVDSEE